MKTRTITVQVHSAALYLVLSLAALLLVIQTGCTTASTEPVQGTLPASPTPVTEDLPPTSPAATTMAPALTATATIDPTPTETTIPATATGEASVPAGWTVHTSQRCEYELSYPAEMQFSSSNPYSDFLDFKLNNPDEGARNFVYISVVDQDFRSLNPEDVYNYDPSVVEQMIALNVGESKALHSSPDMAPWFTYHRLPDVTLSGYPAQAYENVQPWEFPQGTKGIRYFLSLNGCLYQIGAYVDTTGSSQPGAITEDLFNQIVATMSLTP